MRLKKGKYGILVSIYMYTIYKYTIYKYTIYMYTIYMYTICKSYRLYQYKSLIVNMTLSWWPTY